MKLHYGIDLGDLFSEDDPLDPLWVLIHVRALPMGSRFVAALRGGDRFIGWDEGRYMQARAIDLFGIANYIMVLINRDRDKPKPPPPDPYPLPDNVKRTEQDGPGSFGFIAKQKISQARRRQELKRGGVDGWR